MKIQAGATDDAGQCGRGSILWCKACAHEGSSPTSPGSSLNRLLV
jgi:hypothetical protein